MNNDTNVLLLVVAIMIFMFGFMMERRELPVPVPAPEPKPEEKTVIIERPHYWWGRRWPYWGHSVGGYYPRHPWHRRRLRRHMHRRHGRKHR